MLFNRQAHQINVNKFVVVVTALTGLIATTLGIVASVFTESHPMFVEGSEGLVKLLLSWSARELGQGLSCLFVVLFLRDARAFLVVLLSSWVREVLDFIDFFRLMDIPLRMYFVVGISVVLHSIAIVMSFKAIRNFYSEDG